MSDEPRPGVPYPHQQRRGSYRTGVAGLGTTKPQPRRSTSRSAHATGNWTVSPGPGTWTCPAPRIGTCRISPSCRPRPRRTRVRCCPRTRRLSWRAPRSRTQRRTGCEAKAVRGVRGAAAIPAGRPSGTVRTPRPAKSTFSPSSRHLPAPRAGRRRETEAKSSVINRGGRGGRRSVRIY